MKTFFLMAFVAVGLVACAGTPPPKSQPATPPAVVAPIPPQAVQPAPPLSEPAITEVAPAPQTDRPVATTPPTESKAPTTDNAVKKNKPAHAAAPSVAVAAAPTTTNTKTTAPIADARPVAAASEGSAIRGHIDLVVGPDQSVTAGEVADAVVYFVPTNAGAHAKPGQFQIYTRDKHFDPASLVVPVGSTVYFPNQDEIIHNVFSASLGAEFDLGFYGEGGTASQVFKKPGVVLINCNVHQAMQASILVVDTPYYVHPSEERRFRTQRRTKRCRKASDLASARFEHRTRDVSSGERLGVDDHDHEGARNWTSQQRAQNLQARRNAEVMTC